MQETQKYNQWQEFSRRKATANKRFCASWARRKAIQHLYYYLSSVPARQNAIEQKNKTSS